MNNISDVRIEKHIRKAVFKLAPNNAEQIWEKPVIKAAGSEWFLQKAQIKRRTVGKAVMAVSSIAACLMIFAAAFVALNIKADAFVYIDVNPSI